MHVQQGFLNHHILLQHLAKMGRGGGEVVVVMEAATPQNLPPEATASPRLIVEPAMLDVDKICVIVAR